MSHHKHPPPLPTTTSSKQGSFFKFFSQPSENDDDGLSSFFSSEVTSSATSDLFESLVGRKDQPTDIHAPNFLDQLRQLPKSIVLKILNDFYILDLKLYFTIIVRMIYHKFRNNKNVNTLMMKLLFGKFKKEREVVATSNTSSSALESPSSSARLLDHVIQPPTSSPQQFVDQEPRSNSLDVQIETPNDSQVLHSNVYTIATLFKNFSLNIEQDFVNREQSKHKHYYQMIIWLHHLDTFNFMFGNIDINYLEWKVPYPSIFDQIGTMGRDPFQSEHSLNGQLIVGGAKSNRKFLIRSDEHYEHINRTRITSLIQDTLHQEREEEKKLPVMRSDLLFFIYLRCIKRCDIKINTGSEFSFDYMTNNMLGTNVLYLDNISLEGSYSSEIASDIFNHLQSRDGMKFLKMENYGVPCDVLNSVMLPVLSSLSKLHMTIFNSSNLKSGLDQISNLKHLSDLKLIISLNKNFPSPNTCDVLMDQLTLDSSSLDNQRFKSLKRFHLEKDSSLLISEKPLVKLFTILKSVGKLEKLSLVKLPYSLSLHECLVGTGNHRFKVLHTLEIIEPTCLETNLDFSNLTSLVSLTLRCYPIVTTDSSLKSSSSVNLQCKLSQNQLDSLDLKGIHMARDVTIGIASKNNIDQNEPQFLTSIMNHAFPSPLTNQDDAPLLTCVETLNLSTTRIVKSDYLRHHVFNRSGFHNLKVLNLLHCHKHETSIAPELVEQLGKSCPHLITLKWSNFKKKKCFAHLFSYYKHQLKNLTLRHCEFDCLWLAYLFLMTSIKKVSIQTDEPFPDGFIQSIAPLFPTTTQSSTASDYSEVNDIYSKYTVYTVFRDCTSLEYLKIETPKFVDSQLMKDLFAKKSKYLTQLKFVVKDKEQMDVYHELIKELQNGKYK
ncbi:hypothetical protein C9374_006757 [Naegleria lovaniensis]|uniref:Uncharacterized protein n=1 Tax=Naegleria lovaniensis TaxID=51637 RepID=A0AA88GMP7_NAELO|nr:uncharacterized protein C9374_006757 [Naegleria lovaniensis]KAG2379640.1 hypothetical protein C9374_006757 [Naegleria lovaniensis]